MGVKRFPNLILRTADEPAAIITDRAKDWLGRHWDSKAALVASLNDPILVLRSMSKVRAMIRGATEPIQVPDAGALLCELSDRFLKDALQAIA